MLKLAQIRLLALSLWFVLSPWSVAAGAAPPLASPRALANCEGSYYELATHAQPESAHDTITHDLFAGDIVAIRRFSENNNQTQLYLATLRSRDPYTGEVRYREAFFKPRLFGDGDGWSRTPMEYVAYYLNRKLGMDYVPPVAYRRGLNIRIDGQAFTEGALILRAPGYASLATLPNESYPVNNAAVLSDSRVLNVLLQNRDGHHHNLGEGDHWVDGKRRPVFLDFGASLRQGTDVSMTNYPEPGALRPVTQVKRRTLEALRKLSSSDLDSLVQAGFISETERQGILARRAEIIRYFEDLIAQAASQGKPESSVVLDE